MRRIDAQRRVATVQHAEAIRYRAVRQKPCNAVGSRIPVGLGAGSIAPKVLNPRPEPAIVGFIYLTPKPHFLGAGFAVAAMVHVERSAGERLLAPGAC